MTQSKSTTSNFSMDEVLDQSTKTTRKDRISFRLKQLTASKAIIGLDTWQRDMIKSYEFQFNERGDLSDAQFKVLLSIWQDAHSAGLVVLPKGKI